MILNIGACCNGHQRKEQLKQGPKKKHAEKSGSSKSELQALPYLLQMMHVFVKQSWPLHSKKFNHFKKK
jgi:hypothetical protein